MKKNRCVKYLCLGTVVCFIIIGLVFGWQRPFFVFGQQADSELLGQYGDFVGGILGTIFALVSIYFVYKTFYQQLRSFQRQNKTFLTQQQATELQRFNDLFATLSNLLEQAEQRLNASINANFFDQIIKICCKLIISHKKHTLNVETKPDWIFGVYMQTIKLIWQFILGRYIVNIRFD